MKQEFSSLMFKHIPKFIELTRLNKPIGIYLLLWPTLVAVWVAGEGRPPLSIVVIFTLGTVLMRSAGCIINDWADRDWDRHVARTQDRLLTTGQVSIKQAGCWALGLLGGAFALIWPLNLKTWAYAGCALLFTCLYPFMKRITHLPQAFLGLTFAWGIPLAFVAQDKLLGWSALLLITTVVCWVVAYDTEYAMVDRADDLKVGIKSTAILFGAYDRVAIAGLHALVLLQLWLLGRGFAGGAGYGWAVAAIGGLFAYQHWLMRNREPKACFKAFLSNHYVGLIWFVGVLFLFK